MNNTLAEHETGYIQGIWNEYTFKDLGNCIYLLAKRAGHRSNQAIAKKDLAVARNYLAMMDAKLTELERSI